VQAARRVQEHEVVAIGQAVVHGFEGYGRRVRALALGEESGAHAPGPDLELFDCRRAEGVARHDEHLAALQLGPVGQLGDGGCLADAVDAHHHHHLGWVHGLDGLGGLEDLGQLLAQDHLEAGGVAHASLAGAVLELGEQLARGLEAHVGHDQDFLQLVPEVLVHLAVGGEQPVDARGYLLACLGQALGELDEQAAAFVLLVLQVQGQGQAVLQLGAELLHLLVAHVGQPLLEGGDEFVGLGRRSLQAIEQEAQPGPEVRAAVGDVLEHDAQPDGELGFGLAQAQGQLGLPLGHGAGFARGACASGVGRSRGCGLPLRSQCLPGGRFGRPGGFSGRLGLTGLRRACGFGLGLLIGRGGVRLLAAYPGSELGKKTHEPSL